ncbi:hypothetical protein B0H11DRAFT_2197622 [Mycena galericulata]|nr:hypothetical protein B0H11DRAFT_2197622 [Mycena galericulata]
MSYAKKHLRRGGAVSRRIRTQNCLIWKAGVVSLKDLAAKHSLNVHVVKITAGDEADNQAAVAEIKRAAGQLDMGIANADVSKSYGSLATAPISEFREHWEVNPLGHSPCQSSDHASRESSFASHAKPLWGTVPLSGSVELGQARIGHGQSCVMCLEWIFGSGAEGPSQKSPVESKELLLKWLSEEQIAEPVAKAFKPDPNNTISRP